MRDKAYQLFTPPDKAGDRGRREVGRKGLREEKKVRNKKINTACKGVII